MAEFKPGTPVRMKSGSEGWIKGEVVEYYDVIPVVGGMMIGGGMIPGYKVRVLEGKHKGEILSLPANYVEPESEGETMMDYESEISKILTLLNLRPGRGDTIVRISESAGAIHQYELPYEGALAFGNTVYNRLSLPVKIYSKATPGAVYADLKPSGPSGELKPLNLLSKKPVLSPEEAMAEIKRIDEIMTKRGVSWERQTIEGPGHPMRLRAIHSESHPGSWTLWDDATSKPYTPFGEAAGPLIFSTEIAASTTAGRIMRGEISTSELREPMTPEASAKSHRGGYQFILQRDRLGDLIITYDKELGKSVFLQFTHDQQPVIDILSAEEAAELDKGYKVAVQNAETRADVLLDLWEASATPDQPVKNVEIKRLLRQSIQEEKQAMSDYKQRGDAAAVQGNNKVAELYDHVRSEEEQHAKEFQDMLNSL